jgi:hypothetical protein
MKGDRSVCRINAALTKGIQPVDDASSFDVSCGVAFSTKPWEIAAAPARPRSANPAFQHF